MAELIQVSDDSLERYQAYVKLSLQRDEVTRAITARKTAIASRSFTDDDIKFIDGKNSEVSDIDLQLMQITSKMSAAERRSACEWSMSGISPSNITKVYLPTFDMVMPAILGIENEVVSHNATLQELIGALQSKIDTIDAKLLLFSSAIDTITNAVSGFNQNTSSATSSVRQIIDEFKGGTEFMQMAAKIIVSMYVPNLARSHEHRILSEGDEGYQPDGTWVSNLKPMTHEEIVDAFVKQGSSNYVFAEQCSLGFFLELYLGYFDK